jgi:hypothetical protein
VSPLIRAESCFVRAAKLRKIREHAHSANALGIENSPIRLLANE